MPDGVKRLLSLWMLAVLIGTSSCGLGRRDGIADQAFNAALWKRGDRRVRGSMARDLGTGGSLIGLDKRTVVGVLGMPDGQDTSGYVLEYAVDLGLRTGPFGMGGTWLFHTSVAIDTLTGKVITVRTHD
jgi:hypothetical protein